MTLMPDSRAPLEAPTPTTSSPSKAVPASERLLLLAPAVALSTIVLLLAQAIVIGADTMWMVALGGTIAEQRTIPVGVPFAAADSSAWVNVPVLGQLVFAGMYALGPLGLPILTLLIVVGTLITLATSARRLGASPSATAAALVVLTAGCLPAFGVIRGQVLSLLPFAVLMLLLRNEHARPSNRIWWSVPLIALWGNLHGGVLVGLSVLGVHLALSRARVDLKMATFVGFSSVAALFVTPGLTETWRYYVGVLSNEAVQRGSELWAPLDLSKPFDLLAVLSAAVLVGAVIARRRVPLWEWVVLACLTIALMMSARHSMWLLLFVMPRAAVCMTRPRTRGGSPRARDLPTLAVIGIGLVVAAIATGLLLAREATFTKDDAVVSAIASKAGTDIVLAPEPLVESLAAGGVRVWMGNPIDAFDRADQASYLDLWLGEPAGARALDATGLLVATMESPALALAKSRGFREVGRFEDYMLLAR